MDFSTYGAGELGLPWISKIHFDLNLTPFIKINWKCIIYLNVKCTTIKYLGEKNHGESAGCRARENS